MYVLLEYPMYPMYPLYYVSACCTCTLNTPPHPQQVLAKLEEANTIGRQLPPEAFYNDLVSEKLDVYDHYIAWRQTHDMPQQSINGEGPFSFCSYPFLLNPRAKSKLLHVEAKIHQDQCVQACRQEASGGSRPSKATAATAGAEERVLPRKPRALEGEPSGGAFGDEDFMRGARRRGEGRGLRGLFFNMLRNNNDVEEANPREASARIPDASQSLIRHGSMNLPPPERSGIPGVHPEMCIIRVRRSHLSEVGGCCGGGYYIMMTPAGCRVLLLLFAHTSHHMHTRPSCMHSIFTRPHIHTGCTQ